MDIWKLFLLAFAVFIGFVAYLFNKTFQYPKPISIQDLPAETQYARIQDGIMTYVEYGDKKGTPVLFLHGILQTGRILSYLDEDFKRMGLRVICPDRPGWGFSDSFERHALGYLHYISDFGGFIKYLGYEKINLLAISTATPHAAAILREHGEKIDTTVLIQPIPPITEPEIKITDFPDFLQGAIKNAASYQFSTYLFGYFIRLMILREPNNFFNSTLSKLDKEDLELLENEEIKKIYQNDVITSVKRSWHGYANDINLISRGWDFSLYEVLHPNTIILGGENDPFSPEIFLKKYHKGIRGSKLKIIPGTRFSYLVNFEMVFNLFRNATEPL